VPDPKVLYSQEHEVAPLVQLIVAPVPESTGVTCWAHSGQLAVTHAPMPVKRPVGPSIVPEVRAVQEATSPDAQPSR